MNSYRRIWFLLALSILLCTASPAQSLDPSALKNAEEHTGFLERLDKLQQELPRRESDILLRYGYKSPEHSALEDSIRLRNKTLRDALNEYLDLYGFPVRAKPDANRLIRHEELQKEMERLPLHDSIALDSFLRTVMARIPGSLSPRNPVEVVVQILDTEPDFDRRCANISLLRFEYERNNISPGTMLWYLRQTYRIKNGGELGIVTGTTERERLEMYARELSGCWGN